MSFTPETIHHHLNHLLQRRSLDAALQLFDALRDIPPSLYGLVGDLLLRLEAARGAGSPKELLQQAEAFIRVARELEESLPLQSEPTQTIQLIIATGRSIVRNVTQ